MKLRAMAKDHKHAVAEMLANGALAWFCQPMEPG
jgi:hypothetical protein